ncbi:U11/U12 small nuclear ribonucleoprotein 25 kDa protein isoform X2 [Parambassis ranga]|uniref:U11/U12 small nuclear ribonucleoprotein 25 kDa protein isoform X2 n=1 Tax=Parambassis ranga TaxID=210632 RepID=A0A6P7IVF6_9TELE|nr:U11/U12 small nuclear ribonucleoprotein 25 kDa protein isoform X2 [Parambassis ranga]
MEQEQTPSMSSAAAAAAGAEGQSVNPVEAETETDVVISNEEEEDEDALPHSEILDMFEEGLAQLVQDPLLCDLPIKVTLEEINSQIALEYGQAMTVKVLKADGEVMPIVVVQNATVLDLKKAICRFMELKQQREGGVKHEICLENVSFSISG